MRIAVGLGNPGRQYAGTRHNLGFMVIDELARRHHADGFRRRFRAEIATSMIASEKVALVKPQTFMNLSGHSVREVKNWYHAEETDILIVQDDIDLPLGQLRLRARGSAGGHNGLLSIVEQLGTREVPRLKIGVGRGRSAPHAHVLTRFSREEESSVTRIVEAAADAVERWVEHGISEAMNAINGSNPVIPDSPVPA